MDATKMDFLNEDFDLVIDKGTIDALLSGGQREQAISVLKEIWRVSNKKGLFYFVTHGAPEIRTVLLKSSLKEQDESGSQFEIEFIQQSLSDQVNFINILRSLSDSKNLEQIFKSPDILKKAMEHFTASKILKKWRASRSKPKYKTINFEFHTENETKQILDEKISKEGEIVTRQSHCYIYIISKL